MHVDRRTLYGAMSSASVFGVEGVNHAGSEITLCVLPSWRSHMPEQQV